MNPDKKKGFTFVEIMVAIAVFILVMAAVWYMFIGGRRGTQIAEAKLSALETCRMAFEYIKNDLRMAYDNPQDSGDDPKIDENSISFTKFLTEDGELERVTYTFKNNSIIREAEKSRSRVFGNKNSIFTRCEFRNVSEKIGGVTEVRAIEVKLEARNVSGGEPIPLSGRIYPSVINASFNKFWNPVR